MGENLQANWLAERDGGIVKMPQKPENNPSVANATAPFTQGRLSEKHTRLNNLGLICFEVFHTKN